MGIQIIKKITSSLPRIARTDISSGLGLFGGAGAGGFVPEDVPQAEADELIRLYDLGNGDNWFTNTGWKTDPVVGNWFGVTVSGGHVTQVNINNNGGSGDISAFDPSMLPSLTFLGLHINSFSGDLSGWSLPSSLTFLGLHINSFSGDLSGWSLPSSLSSLLLYNNGFSGAPPLPSSSALALYLIDGNGMSQAAVDDVLYSIYAESDSRTASNGTINVGGSNAAPSGTHQAAQSCPVTDSTPGKEVAHELVNDGCGAGISTWAAVTFTS